MTIICMPFIKRIQELCSTDSEICGVIAESFLTMQIHILCEYKFSTIMYMFYLHVKIVCGINLLWLLSVKY